MTNSKISSVASMLASFEGQHAIALQKAEDLYAALTGLHYEGKSSFDGNVKALENVMTFFRDDLLPHIRRDEETLFPYLVIHVPKLDPILRFLCAEHQELKVKFKNFEHLLKKVKAEGHEPARLKETEKLREQGIYLFCLLRNHIQTETESVYKVLRQELNDQERKELAEKCSLTA